MPNEYQGVNTRFLRDDERFVLSEEKEMPMVIEARDSSDLSFLHEFLAAHSAKIIEDMARYGAVLLRGFAVNSDEQFEQTVLSIPEFSGIAEAFMSENGRDPVGNLRYVLHTNSVYKTGGTLYLGGFHTENYYSPDVPSYICFYCAKPSSLGGETGIINTEKIFRNLPQALQAKLQQHSFYVGQWLFSEVIERYKIDHHTLEKICQHFELPIVGEGANKAILMYKPSVLEHPITKEKALQLNLFQLPTLNKQLRHYFMPDYVGKTWFWHRFFWKLPTTVFNAIESIAVACIAFFNSPKKALSIARTSWQKSKTKNTRPSLDTSSVNSCFSSEEVDQLAQLMRAHYSSCLWQKGDILLIDNKKVMHAGMPGSGDRTIRAMICNPLVMGYSYGLPGWLCAEERQTDTIGRYVASGTVPEL